MPRIEDFEDLPIEMQLSLALEYIRRQDSQEAWDDFVSEEISIYKAELG